jgi:hypothetical protein
MELLTITHARTHTHKEALHSYHPCKPDSHIKNVISLWNFTPYLRHLITPLFTASDYPFIYGI